MSVTIYGSEINETDCLTALETIERDMTEENDCSQFTLYIGGGPTVPAVTVTPNQLRAVLRLLATEPE